MLVLSYYYISVLKQKRKIEMRYIMKNYSKITPEGTKDFLFEECLSTRTVSHILGEVFSQRGFHEVLTPGVEFYDVFSNPAAQIPQENMFKLSDSKGRLMVVRPDSTLPIARMTATRLQNEVLPIRLYYNQRVYRNNRGLTGRSNEVMQTGIELLGISGKRADLEIITTAIEALTRCVPDFRIELGHAGFFKALLNKLPVSDNEREDIHSFIEAKNYSALNSFLDTLEQTKAVAAIRRLPRLFGGEEVLNEASELCDDKDALRPLEYLKEIYDCLTKFGLGERLMIDLGLAQRNDYYSDIVFSGYVEGSGEPVLIGGRYDKLLDIFDSPMPASGFGINVDALAKVMLSRGQIKMKPLPDVLVHGDDSFEVKSIKHYQALTQSGLICENSVFSTRDEAIAYAKKKV